MITQNNNTEPLTLLHNIPNFYDIHFEPPYASSAGTLQSHTQAKQMICWFSRIFQSVDENLAELVK